MSYIFNIYFVTGNENKQLEIKNIIVDESKNYPNFEFNLHFIKPSVDIPEIQSTDVITVVENKVSEVAKTINLEELDENAFIVVDDTGYYSHEMPINKVTFSGKGYPGALIKDLMKSTQLDNQSPSEAICRMFGKSDAMVEVGLGIFNCYSHKVSHVSGKDIGKVPKSPQFGDRSFGWDPCFVPNKIGDEVNKKSLSYAQLTEKQKNSCSMREKAIVKLLQHLATQYFEI